MTFITVRFIGQYLGQSVGTTLVYKDQGSITHTASCECIHLKKKAFLPTSTPPTPAGEKRGTGFGEGERKRVGEMTSVAKSKSV